MKSIFTINKRYSKNTMSRLRNKLKSSIEASKIIPDNFEINEYSTYIKELVNDKLKYSNKKDCINILPNKTANKE